MKTLILLLCCLMAINTTHAGRNKKSSTSVKMKEPTKQVPVMENDTQDSTRGYWIQDKRLGRHGYVAPDSADIAKYGIKRPGQNTPCHMAVQGTK